MTRVGVTRLFQVPDRTGRLCAKGCTQGSAHRPTESPRCNDPGKGAGVERPKKDASACQYTDESANDFSRKLAVEANVQDEFGVVCPQHGPRVVTGPTDWVIAFEGSDQLGVVQVLQHCGEEADAGLGRRFWVLPIGNPVSTMVPIHLGLPLPCGVSEAAGEYHSPVASSLWGIAPTHSDNSIQCILRLPTAVIKIRGNQLIVVYNVCYYSPMNEAHERLQTLRKQGWTLQAIADELGVTRNAIQKWNVGQRSPANLRAVLEVLDGLVGREQAPVPRRRNPTSGGVLSDVWDGVIAEEHGPVLEVVAGTPDHPLEIGNIEIPCYVLEDETRVLSERGFFLGLGTKRGGSPAPGRVGAEMPRIFNSQTLAPFISDDLGMALKSPILFKIPQGPVANGYPATLLVEACEVFLEARHLGALGRRHLHIADRCEILVRGLANVGIIALVDEATGYQAIRQRRALATILEKFIAKEFQLWTRTFPYEFYEQIFRLKRWDGPTGVRRPSVIGHYTNDIVYQRLAPGVLDELRRLNPTLPSGARRHRHHQWFTAEIGHPKLREHLAGVTALMRASSTWDAFKRSLGRAFPKIDEQFTLDLGESNP